MNAEWKKEIVNLRLENADDSGDGKRLFINSTTGDGWQELRMEVDTDDVDSKFAKAAAKRVIDCVNACAGIEDLKTLNAS